MAFYLTARPSRSPSAQDRPLRMRRRYAKAQEALAENLAIGERNALSTTPCKCVTITTSTAFRLVVSCKKHQRLRAGLRG